MAALPAHQPIPQQEHSWAEATSLCRWRHTFGPEGQATSWMAVTQGLRLHHAPWKGGHQPFREALTSVSWGVGSLEGHDEA